MTLGPALLLGGPAAEARAAGALGEAAYVRGTGGAGLRLRAGPGAEHGIIGALPEGARVDVLDGPQRAGGDDWYQIRATDGAASRAPGWAAGAYLVPAGRVPPPGEGGDGRRFVAVVTGYTSGGGVGSVTATGTRVHWGTVSVDPRLVRLGSLLAIDGLDGVFSAEDTGAAVQGAVLDVWFPERDAALRWGAQRRTVTVLREGY
jgi:3D (Asp-Asp-Asp) domain-containing protein